MHWSRRRHQASYEHMSYLHEKLCLRCQHLPSDKYNWALVPNLEAKCPLSLPVLSVFCEGTSCLPAFAMWGFCLCQFKCLVSVCCSPCHVFQESLPQDLLHLLDFSYPLFAQTAKVWQSTVMPKSSFPWFSQVIVFNYLITSYQVSLSIAFLKTFTYSPIVGLRSGSWVYFLDNIASALRSSSHVFWLNIISFSTLLQLWVEWLPPSPVPTLLPPLSPLHSSSSPSPSSFSFIFLRHVSTM